jgi:hypothetical protein
VELVSGNWRTIRTLTQLPSEIGVGKHDQIDLLKVRWFDLATTLTEVPVQAQSMDLVELMLPTGSCPYLFAWDGQRFKFVTDILGASPLGLPVSATRYIEADPEEYLALGNDQQFPAKNGLLDLRITEELREVLRDYLAGMTMVTLMVIAASSLFFWMLGMEYPILTGIVSSLLNMVPYIGAVLAWLPAFLIALAKWRSASEFILIAGGLTGIHVLAINFVAPQLVGRRVRLNAVAITIALLFWGWVWGGMGLLLAIPITATLRVICDHTESWKPIGRWLSA